MVKKQRLLVAVTGMTPQVVTETLYALSVQRFIPIDQIFIITTLEGKNKIEEVKLHEKIQELCTHYKVIMPSFNYNENVYVAREESVELSDIRNDKENELFPNLIVEVIRTLADEPNNQLFCSVAGGRKTMSVAMAYALSLFGRKDDELLHVLVSKELEHSGKFYPQSKKEDTQLVMATIPYIRLREKLPLLRQYPKANFIELVKYAQHDIDELKVEHPLVFDSKTFTVGIGDNVIKLKPFDFAVYLYVAKCRKPMKAGKHLSESDWEKILMLYDKIFTASGVKERVKESGKKDYISHDARLTKSVSTIRNALKKELGEDIAMNYTIRSIGEYGNKMYSIRIPYAKRVFR